jgi:hypothetical protein
MKATGNPVANVDACHAIADCNDFGGVEAACSGTAKTGRLL